jgi:hypothetical protein
VILKHIYSKDFEKQLGSCGVRYNDIMAKSDSLDVESALETIKPEVFRVISKTVNVAKQYKVVEHLLENIEKYKGVFCISSFPSDERAKFLTTSIIENLLLRRAKSKKSLSKPLWHRIYGGFKDELRDKHIDKPSLLVLSNIDCSSNSSVKIEKIRDILEKFEGIPIIVVLAGPDPLSFFGNVLHYPLRAGIMLGPPNRIKEI